MKVLSQISTLAKKAIGKMPKPVESNLGIHDDANSAGHKTIQMVDRLRSEARQVHGEVESEAIRGIHSYFGNQWDQQRLQGDRLDAQRRAKP